MSGFVERMEFRYPRFLMPGGRCSDSSMSPLDVFFVRTGCFPVGGHLTVVIWRFCWICCARGVRGAVGFVAGVVSLVWFGMAYPLTGCPPLGRSIHDDGDFDYGWFEAF